MTSTAEIHAADVSLPEQGQIRAVAFDSGGFTQDIDAIIATIASAVTEQTISGAGLDGVIGASEITPPRNVELTLNSHADWDATTAVVTGTDYNDDTITENLSIPNGGNATVAGVKLFKTVVSLLIPAQSGTNGTADLGTGLICSLEEFAADGAATDPGVPGRYIGFIANQAFYITAGAAGAAIETPDTTITMPTSAAEQNQRTFGPYAAGVVHHYRPKIGVTDAIKVLRDATDGTLRWGRMSG